MSSSAAEAVPGRGATGVHERRTLDRRAAPTPLLSRWSFWGGRRRGDRRAGASVNTYVDVYDSTTAFVLVAIGVLCALDAVFTLMYLQKGGEEANPLMAAVIEWGPRPFILFKCAVTNVGLAVLCLHKNFRWVRTVIGALFAAYVLLFVYHLFLAYATA